MIIRKYSVLIVFTFLSIFAVKMIISGTPVFFNELDKELMRSVIMQLETENNSEDSGKSVLKSVDFKLTQNGFETYYTSIFINLSGENDFIEHYRRYVNPYHPSVPTPPPNFLNI